jgi:glycosyltransferase involved in cell wall biosynthesis
MKLLYFSPHPRLKLDAPTGYGTHMREMIAAWIRMGIEVKHLIAGDLTGDAYGEHKPSKFARFKSMVPPTLWESVKDFQLLRFDSKLEHQLDEAVREFEPDLIYERTAYLQNSGINVASRHGIKHVSEINAPFPEERVHFSGKSLFLKQARDHERQILAKTDLISTVSSALKSHLSEKLSRIEEKILVIPNSVNPLEVVHKEEDKEEIRTTYQLQGKVVIGFVGSIFPYHGIDLLIDAFSKISDGVDCRLLIVGDGITLPDLKARARLAGVLDRCIFTGSVPHRKVYAFIEAMDLCCMPKSNWYGSPVKLFEYGLMEKPIIAPDVAPVKDVMEDRKDGLLVDPDSDKLAEAIAFLLEHEELARKMAISWRTKVLSEYTWDHAAKRIIKACT